MARLIIVSNRLPVSLHAKPDGTYAMKQSIGGLATAIGPYHKSHNDCLWVGWSSIDPDACPKSEIKSVTEEFKSRRCVPIFLTQKEIDGYYAGYANDTLWPLFHDFAHEATFDSSTWKVYQEVNQKFADAIIEFVNPDDTVWIQDYHLMLLPAMLRSRFPKLKIGWFLHIPFPSPEIFHQLPNGKELLEGLMGADLLGFHTEDFCVNFLASVRALLGLEVDKDGRIPIGSGTSQRFVTVDAFPIGIDYGLYRRNAHSSLAQAMRHGIEAVSGKRTRRVSTSLTAESEAAAEASDQEENWWSAHTSDELPEVELAQSAAAKRGTEDNKVVVSVDRLDYTKGLPERLRAFDLMLSRYPEWVGHVTYYLLATPTREDVETYRKLKDQVDQLVGEINGKYSLLSWTPIHYITRSLPIKPVCGIYTAGDVALVTPLRDGMNLVAKEYLASRDGRDGALVLSDECGAARELTDAFIVNPYDTEAVCEALHSALEIGSDEAKRRNAAMQARLKYRTAGLWSAEFLSTLRQVSDPRMADRRLQSVQRDHLVHEWGQSKRKLVLCDYDGTLTQIVRTPGRAKPTHRLLDLLREVGSIPDVDLYLVSGRTRETMDEWFGCLPIGLIAEHGAWHTKPIEGTTAKNADGRTIAPKRYWRRADGLPDPDEWRPIIETIMNKSVARVPQSFIEYKSTDLAWHYRMSDQKLAQEQRERLVDELQKVCPQYGLMVMRNAKVIEVCPANVSKGEAVKPLLESGRYDFVLALGDDTTDETMFASVSGCASARNKADTHDVDNAGVVKMVDSMETTTTVDGSSAESNGSKPAKKSAAPSAAWTIKVGAGDTNARSRIATPTDTGRLLGYLVAESEAVAAGTGPAPKAKPKSKSKAKKASKSKTSAKPTPKAASKTKKASK
ncbi:trehalose-phosphatase [Bifidobacterium sp. ESL0690]|uniref:trehalose-phosphatase n=1 Tax=Bifidobacterium sp. ESL0690 TaxID=2983214 RepID=UPI0023FA19C7|nr:trehalose-phosphatase [Bifidobacterium sp. ESL0690]WEV46838.1 trehalose-phosphatase [Bifidobacterium sp. ESL0690]